MFQSNVEPERKRPVIKIGLCCGTLLLADLDTSEYGCSASKCGWGRRGAVAWPRITSATISAPSSAIKARRRNPNSVLRNQVLILFALSSSFRANQRERPQLNYSKRILYRARP